MVEATYTLHADADGDEIFETDEALIDVVRDGGGITYSRGLDGIRRLDEARAGDFGAFLDNRAGTYNPGAAGEILRGVSLKLRAAYGGTTRGLCHMDISRVKHWPALTKKAVELQARGKLARLAKRPVSTTLYQNITTGQAIGYVLDAVDYRKNAQAYITGLTPAAQWGLGAASGTEADLSGNANTGTVTIGAGARDATALDDAGDGCIDFDGAATLVTVADAASIQNIFDGGGALALLCNIDSDGEGDVGRLVDKAGWYLNVQNESGGLVRLNFRVGFSGTQGIWQSAVNVPISTTLLVVASYNGDATTNDPTIYLYNLSTETLSTLTVGSGLTETSTPVGTRTTDVGSTLTLGNNAAGSATFDGRLDEVALFSAAAGLTAAQVKGIASRSKDAPRHLDAGQTTIPFYHADATDALAELMRITRTEGPGAYLYEDDSGAITFLNRHSTITQTRSNTAQGTFRGTGAAPKYSDFDYDDGLDEVVNEVKASAIRRKLAAAGYLWQTDLPYSSIAPGETKKVTARLDDPATSIVTGLLTTNPTYASTLAAAITDTVSLTFTVPTGEAPTIATNAVIDIEGEYLVVTGRTTGSPNDTVTVRARGEYGTTAATHLISTAVRTRAFVANANTGFTGTDLTSAITVSISRTGGISTEFTFTNTGTQVAYLFSRLYGQEAAVQERYEVTNTVDASASIAAYGRRSYNLDVIPEVTVDTLQDWCNAVVGWYQDGRPTASIEVIANRGADEMAQVLDREIADRVRIIHAGIGVDMQAQVHRIEHTIELGGGLHRAQLLCESADLADYFELDEDELDGGAVLGW